MKKVFALFILALLVFSALPVCAASNEVLKGTPTIDGVLDEIYTQSVSQTVTTDNQVYNSGAEYADSDYKGTSYLLYDDNYFYICDVVSCSAPIDTAGDDYVLNMDDANPWINDVAENWVSFDAGASKIKLSLDAYGKRIFGDPAVTGSEGYIGAAKITDTGYIVELAIPYKGAAGAEVDFSLQLNDKIGTDGILAIGSQTPVAFTLSADSVTYPKPETEAPVTEAVTEAAPAAAAQTSDVLSVAALAAIFAASAVVLTKKKAAR